MCVCRFSLRPKRVFSCTIRSYGSYVYRHCRSLFNNLSLLTVGKRQCAGVRLHFLHWHAMKIPMHTTLSLRACFCVIHSFIDTIYIVKLYSFQQTLINSFHNILIPSVCVPLSEHQINEEKHHAVYRHSDQA